MAQLAFSLSNRAGGIFEILLGQSHALRNLEVGVQALGLEDDLWSKDRERWGAVPASVFSVQGPRFFSYSPGFSHALENVNPDLCHLHSLWMYPGVAMERWSRKNDRPYMVTPNGMLEPWALRNSGWKKRLAGLFYENAMLRGAACLQANTLKEADDFRAYGLKNRIEIVPNGVDLTEKLTTEDTESTERKKRLLFLGRIHPKKGLVELLRVWADIQNPKSGIKNSKNWELVVAGWDQLGHEAELRSLCRELGLRFKEAKLTTECTECTECTEVEAGLRLAGQAGAAFSNPTPSELVQDYESTSLIRSASGPADSGNLKLNSYKLKTERALDIQGGLRSKNGSSRRLTLPDVDVVFFGPAFGEEKEALFRSADAFILPSFSEGLPMSVLEAWSYGLPVVMTPGCNLPEGFACGAALEIRKGERSFQGSDFSFQHGLQLLIEMTQFQRWEMGMRGRKLVEEKFTWPKVAESLKEIYESLL